MKETWYVTEHNQGTRNRFLRHSANAIPIQERIVGTVELEIGPPPTKTVTREARIASMSTYPGGVSSVASEFIPAGAKNIRVVYDIDVPA